MLKIGNSAEKYRMIVNGRRMLLDSNQIGQIIKSILKKSVPVQKMFDKFNVSLDRINDLQIELVRLDKKYAFTDDKKMQINSNLLRDESFFEKYTFVFVHEIVHFLTRISEKRAHYNDPEEQESLVVSLAHEISSGSSYQDLWKTIFPTVEFHFHNKNDAILFFKRMILKAKKLL